MTESQHESSHAISRFHLSGVYCITSCWVGPCTSLRFVKHQLILERRTREAETGQCLQLSEPLFAPSAVAQAYKKLGRMYFFLSWGCAGVQGDQCRVCSMTKPFRPDEGFRPDRSQKTLCKFWWYIVLAVDLRKLEHGWM